MWGSRERESIITPKLRAWGEGETMVPSIVSVGELVTEGGFGVDEEEFCFNAVEF